MAHRTQSVSPEGECLGRQAALPDLADCPRRPVQDADEIRQIYEKEGFAISVLAEEILTHPDFHLEQEAQELDLVLMTPTMLEAIATEDGYSYSSIFRAMRNWGLEPCPPEAVIAARLVFPEQEYNGDDYMAIMKPYTHSRTMATRSCLELAHHDSGENDDEPLIELNAYDPDSSWWNGECTFVCVLPRV